MGKLEVDDYPDDDTPSKWSEIVRDAHGSYSKEASVGKTTIGGKTVFFDNNKPGLL